MNSWEKFNEYLKRVSHRYNEAVVDSVVVVAACAETAEDLEAGLFGKVRNADIRNICKILFS